MVIVRLFEAIVLGISLGMLYVLVALGLTLIFGMMGVVNFAHGAFVTLGAYVGIVTVRTTGNFWLAILAAGVFVGFLGVAVERSLIKRIYDQNPIYQLLLTFGVALLIEGGVILAFGQSNQRITAPTAISGNAITIGPLNIPQYRLFLAGFTATILLVIWLAINRTKLGLVVKAGIEDRERVELLGVRINRVNMLIMGLGSALAAVAGFLAGPMQGVDPHLGTSLLIISFVIIVIGGLGNIKGTIVAGILVGIIMQVGLYFYPTVASPLVFLTMAGVLLVRPHGMFGRPEA